MTYHLPDHVDRASHTHQQEAAGNRLRPWGDQALILTLIETYPSLRHAASIRTGIDFEAGVFEIWS